VNSIPEIFKKVYTEYAQDPDMSRKIRTSIYIDERIKLIAEALGISLSHVVENAVLEEARRRLMVFENMHRFQTVAPAGFEPASPDPESLEPSIAVIDYGKVRKAFKTWLEKRVAEDTARQYMSYLDTYLTKPLTSPFDLEEIIEDIEEETRGGKLRWFSAAFSNLLNFYKQHLKYPSTILQPYRDVLKWEKSGTDKVVPSDEDIIEANEHFKKVLNQDEYLVFLLLVFSGLRLKHILRMLRTYDPRKLEIIGNFARYNMEDIGKGKKEAYECYMPAWVARKLKRLDFEYQQIRDRINYTAKSGKVVSARYIRKWTNSFLRRQGIKDKDVRNFILGRPGEIEQSVEFHNYLNLREEADEAYARIVEKFPIKEVGD